jgi:D-3-phosphoglycerate dehydrogenase
VTKKILLTDGLADNGKAILNDTFQADDQTGISAEDLLSVIGDYEGLIVRGRTKVTDAVLAAGTKLEIVGRMGVGVDNIDLDAAKARGVAVVNSPTATSIAVAELTFALMLDLARLTPRADATMKAGQWEKKNLVGTELFGKTLGIVGVGNIGGAVAERARAFRMDVLGYDAWLSEEKIRSNGADPVPLDEVIEKSDYISLHIPLTPDTKGIINAETIGKMKAGVRIVCAARGGVIDEAALLDALNSGQVAAAGLDVFEQEPPGATDLVTHPNVVASPHIGGQTKESQIRAASDIANEIVLGLKGEDLRWKIV